MRTRTVPLLFVLVLAAILAVPAAASKPRTHGGVVVKTASMLGASSYPWVEPIWVTSGRVRLPKLPVGLSVHGTQPPAWIPIA